VSALRILLDHEAHRICSAFRRVLEGASTLHRWHSWFSPSLMLRFSGGHEKVKFGPQDAHLKHTCHHDHGLLRHILWNTHGHLSNTMKRPNESNGKSISNIKEDSQPRLRAYASTYHHIITSSTSLSSCDGKLRFLSRTPACRRLTPKVDECLDAITANQTAFPIQEAKPNQNLSEHPYGEPTTSSLSFSIFLSCHTILVCHGVY
jgi:hypothetical protein